MGSDAGVSFFDDLSSGDVERLASVFAWDDECSSEEPGECFGVVWMGEEWEEEGSVGGRWVDSKEAHRPPPYPPPLGFYLLPTHPPSPLYPLLLA